MQNQAHLVGSVLNWTNDSGSDVSSGAAVPVGDVLGVAAVDIANTEKGSVAIMGVFNLPKADAAVIAIGERVHYDLSAGAIVASGATLAAGDIQNAGVAFESKGATTGETIAVKLGGAASAAQ